MRGYFPLMRVKNFLLPSSPMNQPFLGDVMWISIA